MSAKFVLLLAIIGYAYGQSCLKIIGTCVMNSCPTGATCFSGVTCCITDSTENCNDTMDICPSMQKACDDATAGPAVKKACPYTCKACNLVNPTNSGTTLAPGTSSTPYPLTCVDKINPVTGVSDCPQDKYLCNDVNYKNLMRQQCPKTCGYC